MAFPSHLLPLSAGILAAGLLWTSIVWRWRHRLRSFLWAYACFLRGSFRAPGWLWLLSLPLACLAIALPFEYDESYTFLKFTRRGLLHSLATYPAPNNHVLHSLLTNMSWMLLGWTRSEAAVRLPSILATLLTLLFVSRVILKGSHLFTAVFAALFCWSDCLFVSAFQARGYSLQGLCAVVGLAAVMGRDALPVGHRFGGLLITCIMGLYTSPGYLYAALPLALMFVASEAGWLWQHAGKVLMAVTLGGASVVLLYAPILLNEGVGALTSNRFVQPVSSVGMPEVLRHALGVGDWVVLPGLAGVVLTAFTVGYALFRRCHAWFVFLLAPLAMMLLLRQLPFDRVFHANGLVILAYAVWGLGRVFPRADARPRTAMVLAALLIAPAFLWMEKRDAVQALWSAFARRRIDAYVREGEAHAWRLHWSFLDPLNAKERLEHRGRFTALPDSASRFPTTGILLSSSTIDSLECLDTILHASDGKVRCFIYRLSEAGQYPSPPLEGTPTLGGCTFLVPVSGGEGRQLSGTAGVMGCSSARVCGHVRGVPGCTESDGGG